MKQTIQWLVRGLALFGAAAVVLLMLHIVADTSLRYLRGAPLRGTLEYVQFWWMVTIAYGGLAWAERQREHIAAPVLFDLAPLPVQRLWLVFGNALTATIMLIFVIQGWRAAEGYRAFGEVGGAAGVPIWHMRYWVPIGAVAYVMQIVMNTLEDLRQGTLEGESFPSATVL